MIVLLTFRCTSCNLTHAATEEAHRRTPTCPFCGSGELEVVEEEA